MKTPSWKVSTVWMFSNKLKLANHNPKLLKRSSLDFVEATTQPEQRKQEVADADQHEDGQQPARRFARPAALRLSFLILIALYKNRESFRCYHGWAMAAGDCVTHERRSLRWLDSWTM